MKNAEAEREKELKAAQQKLNQAKSKADAFNKRLKEKQQVLHDTKEKRSPLGISENFKIISFECLH